MKLPILGLSLVMGMASLVSTVNVQASDWKGYPGSACQPHSGANDVRRLTSGVIANWQNTSTFIHCPLVRDVQTGKPNGALRARVRLYDNNANAGHDGYCRLIARDINGNVFSFDHANFGGHGARTLTLGPLDTSNWGTYSLYCKIPAADGARRSFIRSYSLEEL